MDSSRNNRTSRSGSHASAVSRKSVAAIAASIAGSVRPSLSISHDDSSEQTYYSARSSFAVPPKVGNLANMDHYEDDETPALLQQLLRQNASDGFGPSAENPAADQYDDHNFGSLDPIYRVPSVASTHLSSQSGHTARSLLPSVLNPTGSGLVTLTYEEACVELKRFCEELSQNGCTLAEKPVAVVAYDEKGGQTSCHQINLTIDLDLKSLINVLQDLIDQREREPSYKGKGRFLIRSVDIRSGHGEMDRSFPAIEGAVIEAPQTSLSRPLAQWVTWDCSEGPMENYWNYYRIAMQLGIGIVPNGPILKLRTVKCQDIYDSEPGGHIYNSGGSQYQRARRYSGGKPPGGGVFGNMSSTSGALPGIRTQLNPIASAFKFGVTIEESIDDANTLRPTSDKKGKEVAVQTLGTSGTLHEDEHKSVGKKVIVDASTTTGWKKAPIPDWDSLPPAINYNPGGYQAKPTSWAYWQRIGGDPETHKEFPLGHIPYPETPDTDHCDYLPGEPLDMKASIDTAMKALANNEQPVMPKLSAEEQAIIDQITGQTRKDFNNARGFDQEDDDIFISTANPNWDPNGPKDQLTKDKEGASALANMANDPSKYHNQPTVTESKPGPPSYVSAYYNRPAQQNTMTGTSSIIMSGTDSPIRFASPRTTQSKSTFPSGGRARPFTPSQMTSFQSLNAGSRSSTPTLRYGGSTSSFAMPSASMGFNAPPNTISRSRPSSPANANQMVDQFATLNMANTQGPSRGHHNQLFVPGFGTNASTAQGHGNLPQNFEDWNIAQGETKYPFE
ncbi:hypothetical protein SBOR_4851 [Sclerotinia borealis F-4128]|uniref:Uncharacterized protein n=1 Tax=Sclerotinia borealis (strain F-4128) TaxID=1432307 RepID=W9CJ79_SCLBF|nr:hypothetical protein SBOR_4851 [Sclerotinia borealis F-4128]